MPLMSELTSGLLSELGIRVFALDVLHCVRSGGRRQLLSLVTAATTAQKVLNCLGLQSQAPSQSPDRAPRPFP